MSGEHPPAASRSQPAGMISPRPSLRGLVAIAAALTALGGVVLSFVSAAVLVWIKPDLSDNSLILPLLGAIIMGGSCMALIGLLAGIIDLFQTARQRGLSVLAVFINGSICLVVLALIVLTMMAIA